MDHGLTIIGGKAALDGDDDFAARAVEAPARAGGLVAVEQAGVVAKLLWIFGVTEFLEVSRACDKPELNRGKMASSKAGVSEGDGAAVSKQTLIKLKGKEDADLLLFDLA